MARNEFGIDWSSSTSILGGKKESKERDTRRAFTQSQKKQLQYQQGGKCAVCRKQLEAIDIEYDHKKPWAANGRTVTANGRALCGSCHNKVTHSANVKKADGKKKPKRDNSFQITMPKLKMSKLSGRLF